MSNLNQIIDFTKLSQDVELATAIGQLKQNPAQLQQFIQGQQDKVYKDIVKQKDSTFEKVYGDLNRATQAQESVVMYDKRNKELAQIQQEIYDNQKNSANAVTEDKNLAGRKYEMNEWSVNNKKDTLFVYSFMFITLSALILITVLWRLGLIGSGLWVGLAAPIIIVCILVIAVRSQYTNVLRNKRYWNRKIFEGKYGKIPIPLCPGALDGVESSVQSVEQGVESGVSSVSKEVSGMAQSISSDISSAAAKISSSL